MPGLGKMKLATTYCPRSGWITGASGLAPNSGSRTGSRTSYSTSIRSTRLLGDLHADGSHADDRVAHVAHPVAAEDEPVLEVQPDVTGEILARDNRLHAGQGARFLDIDLLDQRMRVRAALDARMQQGIPELDVIRVERRAGHLFVGIDARGALADRD